MTLASAQRNVLLFTFLFFYFDVQHQHKYKLAGWVDFGVSQRVALRFWAQLGLDIVDQMWVEFRMRSWGCTMSWSGHILGEYIFLETLLQNQFYIYQLPPFNSISTKSAFRRPMTYDDHPSIP